MEGGVAGGGAGPGTGPPGAAGAPNGRPPGADFKKRGRSKKSVAAGLRNGRVGEGVGGPPRGLYDMGNPGSPGKPVRHLSGFPFPADLKGQPLPAPLYQDFAGAGGRLSPPRMVGGDNGFNPAQPFPHAPPAEAAWPPPEYQAIVPDYFPGTKSPGIASNY